MWIGGVLCTSFDAYYVAVLAALVCVCVSVSNPNWPRTTAVRLSVGLG